MAINGMVGGIDALLALAKKPTNGPWQKKAMDAGVLHVGNKSGFNQFRPKGMLASLILHDIFVFSPLSLLPLSEFVEPIIRTAVGHGANNLVYVVTEGAYGRVPAPNHGCFGDRDKMMVYLAKYTETKKHYGIYYKLFDTTKPDLDELPVKAYLDFDFKYDTATTPWADLWLLVLKAIELVNNAILDDVIQQSDQAQSVTSDYHVCYGARDIGNGNTKFSFHVVWQNHGFVSNKDQRAFMANVLGGQNTQYDPNVYGTHQLMRLPWCGKGKNVDAVLLPTKFVFEEGKWNKTVEMPIFDPVYYEYFDINASKDTLLHVFQLSPTTGSVAVRGAKTKNVTGFVSHETEMIRKFFDPLLRSYLLPQIQAHRLRLCQELTGVRDARAGVSTIHVTSLIENGSKPGQVRLRVINDTFCEHDSDGATPHFHNGTQGTILIDYREGWYQQLCFRCSGFKKRYSIFGSNCLNVSGLVYGSHSPHVLDILPKQGSNLMLRFYQDVLQYDPDQGGIVVYNKKAKIWIACRRTGHSLMTKRHVFCDTYVDYRCAVNLLSCMDKINLGHKKSKVMAKKKADDDKVRMREYMPNTQKPCVDSLCDAWEKTFDGFSKLKLNHRKDLVPLNDGNCYEVRTGQIVARTKDMYFTSFLNATVKHDALDSECTEIRRWFMEVARERRTLSEYMRRVCGLLMTSMEFDRKFYVNLGKGSNGKSVLFKVFEVIYHSTPKRL